jgi:hypothetical protein
LLASKVTNEEEEEVLEEYERMQKEALGLPEVPIHSLPRRDPEETTQVPVREEEREEERQAVLA